MEDTTNIYNRKDESEKYIKNYGRKINIYHFKIDKKMYEGDINKRKKKTIKY